jgi:hypothetical protein
MGKNFKMKHMQHKDSAAVANVLLLFAMHRSRSLEHICRSATLEALVGIPADESDGEAGGGGDDGARSKTHTPRAIAMMSKMTFKMMREAPPTSSAGRLMGEKGKRTHEA